MTVNNIGSDTQTLMLFEANKKSAGVAYLLWLFFGGIGAHRFYAGKIKTGAVILLLTVLGIATAFIGVGLIFIVVVGLWVLIDAFLIPGWIRNYNTNLITKLGGAGPSLGLGHNALTGI
jgi:TM2 domain-containing membrane protein YozV